MSNRMILQWGAAFFIAFGVVTSSFADDARPSGGSGHGPAGGHSAISGGLHMPPHNFRSVPPSFHGPLPHPSVHGALSSRRPVIGPGHDGGLFHGHDFAHFTVDERSHWQHGSWHHIWHHGHFGWWWYVDDFWFFYPAPIYPYPLYVGSTDYYDYSDEYGAPDYYWYYCADPEGYYPYVTDCNIPWEPVPPTPEEQ